MRGYATLIAGFIMTIILFTSISLLFVLGMRENAKIRDAEAFSSQVDALSEKIKLNVIHTDWNRDANAFFTVITNSGSLPVDLNDIAVFVDGVFVGRCGDINCTEANPNGELTPFEELNVVFEHPIYPHRFTASGGPVIAPSYPSLWQSGCRYRRMVFVENQSPNDLNGYQIPVDLPTSFDYSHAASDGSDVLFTLSDSITEIPYWIEDWNASGESRIWTVVDVPAGSSTYVYMYYGGCSPSSWSADDVFDTVIPDLVSYWNFEEGDGNVAHDVSGGGYDMNLVHVQWFSGPRGGAIYIDGDLNSHGIVSGFEDFPSDSITAFFRMETNDFSRDGTPFSYAKDPSDNEFLIYNYRDFHIYRVGNNRVSANAFATADVWHDVAASWDVNGHYAFYMDGEMNADGSGLMAGVHIMTGGTLVIGQEQDEEGGGFKANQSFKGYMDDVVIFNRVLSLQEILALGEKEIYATADYPGYALIRKYVSVPPTVSVRGEEHI